jgi:UDP-N-acetylglucosamine:LPS N-acetylglucosamine transferase
MERAGACRVVLERELEARLAPEIADLLTSSGASERRQAMQQAYAKLGLPDPERCAGRLADLIETLGEKT